MNRSDRRAAARNQRGVARKPAGKRPVDPLVGLRILDNARPFDEGDNLEQHIKTRAAFARLRDGSADNNDFDRVALAINLAKVRALEIDDTLAGMLTDAQNAMTALRKRKVRWGKWDMLDTEASLVVEALDAAEVIVDASSPLQMHLATLVVRRSILANIAAKKAQKETRC